MKNLLMAVFCTMGIFSLTSCEMERHDKKTPEPEEIEQPMPERTNGARVSR